MSLLSRLGASYAAFTRRTRRRHIHPQGAAAEAAQKAARIRAAELEQLVAFAHALTRAVDDDAIRVAVRQHLPAVADTSAFWVLLRRATTWEMLVGETRRQDELAARENFSQRLLEGVTPPALVSGDMVGFPLVVAGSPVGVLGVQLQGSPLVPNRQRMIAAAAAILSHSLKHAQLSRDIRDLALRDLLTGCATRRHATEVIDAELRRARRSLMPVSLIVFDLDHFKEVNDRYGATCGDAVLAAVGQRMAGVLRGSDLKCRYGGEEFLVLLPETPLHGARRVAETLRREISDRPIEWAGGTLTVTASFGITQAMPGEINIQPLLARADGALGRAKDDGRNCVRIAADSLSLLPQHKPSAAG
jgi:diguanylate cyclase (GGDEF)-like protein